MRYAAATIGADEHLARLEPGRLAHVVLLEEDPLLGTRHTTRIWRVVLGGGSSAATCGSPDGSNAPHGRTARDAELFDLEADPDEINNLAADPKAHGDLLLAMNEKLTRLIEDEVGEDRGQFLPENKAGWNVTTIDP